MVTFNGKTFIFSRAGEYEQHNMANTPEYGAWCQMKHRCTNPKSQAWHNYGGRGITVCDEWQKSFTAFFEHIGARPGRGWSVDRIDNNGNYEPGNVRWATAKMQANNSRNKKCLNSSTP